MVIYGNTAEDLGQFNIKKDFESSLPDTVSAIEGNLEDLPPAFRPTELTIKEPASPLKILSQAAVLNFPTDLRKFLLLVFRILDSHNLDVAVDKVISLLLSVTSSYGFPCLSHKCEDVDHTLTEAAKELLDLYRSLQNPSGDPSAASSPQSLFDEFEAGLPTSKEFMENLNQHFDFCSSAGNVGCRHLSKVTEIFLLW